MDILGTKRIINLASTTEPTAEDNFVVDSASGGTKRIKLSNLIDPTFEEANKMAGAAATGAALSTKASAIEVTTEAELYNDLSKISAVNDFFTCEIENIDTSFNQIVIANSQNVIGSIKELSNYAPNALTITLDSNKLTINGTTTAGATSRIRTESGKNDIQCNIKNGDTVSIGVIYKGTPSARGYNCAMYFGSESHVVSNFANGDNSIVTFTATADNDSFTMQFYSSGGITYEDFEICPFVIVGNYITKAMAEVSEGKLVIGSADIATFTKIYTPAFLHVLQYVAKTKEYIDNHIPVFDFDNIVYSREYYVSPEMFGAKGDNNTDDYQALQNCINYAITNGIPVRGYKKYKSSGTIVINTDEIDLYINRLTYSGSAAAVTLTGSLNNIHFGTIYALTSGARGVELVGSASEYVTNNKIQCDYIRTSSHCFHCHDDGGHVMSGNQFAGNLARCGNGSILYNEAQLSESTFQYGRAQNTGGFAFYMFNGVLTIISANLEECYAGILLYNGNVYILRARIAEMVNKRRIDATDERGLLCAWESGGRGAIIMSELSDNAEYVSVDPSNRSTNTPGTSLNWLDYVNIVGKVITYYNYDYNSNKDGAMKFPATMVVYGNRKALIPLQKTGITVSNNIDLSNMKYMPPYRFAIETDGITIKLDSSYCPYGVTEFVVDQSAGYYADFYDVDNNIVFDGSAYGTGVFKVTIMQVDYPQATAGQWGWIIGDPLNWIVTKLTEV